MRRGTIRKLFGAVVLAPALALIVHAACEDCKPVLGVNESDTLTPGDCLSLPPGDSCYSVNGNGECYNNPGGECVDNPTGGNITLKRTS